MRDLELTGLDGQNPLAFLAALGLLRVLDEQLMERKGSTRPRLAFAEEGRVAMLRSSLSIDEVYELVLKDAAGRCGAAALSLAYDDQGKLIDADHEDANADLKPSPDAAAAYLASLLNKDRRSMDLGAAFFSELGQDNKDRKSVV